MLVSHELAGLLEAVVKLAVQAGGQILAVYDAPVVQHKDDASPLTDADLASHRVLVAGLQALTPDWPVLSEESRAVPFAERATWQRYWLIDPLDGTKEFIKRNGEFTVNVALIDHGRPILGVVHAPALGDTYLAAEGLGAFRDDADGRRRAIAVRSPCQGVVRVVGSRSHGSPDVEAMLGRLGDHAFVAIGSSLKFCLVAEGKADCYPRLGPTSEWDTAAAQAVLEVAGGRVVALDGQPLRYNRGESLLNPHFLACGDPQRDWLAILQAQA